MKKIMKGLPPYFEMYEGRKIDDTSLLYLMANVDTSCSYRCLQCAVDGKCRTKSHSLSFDEYLQIFHQMHELGAKVLVVIGNGEPTENFGLLRPLLSVAHACGLTTILFSNLSALTLEQAEFYRDNEVSMYVSLASLDVETYRTLTGGGDLTKVLNNIVLLRSVYHDTWKDVSGMRILRLGINTTVFQQNKNELVAIRDFAANDMQFIANSPMYRGQIRKGKVWKFLVGDGLEDLTRFAKIHSDTGGHSSIADGVCRYFFNGISIDTDGQLLICGYASDTTFGDVRKMSSDQILKCYSLKQEVFKLFLQHNDSVSCPLRGGVYESFIKLLKSA